jgi:UDP-glucose 4-epimerase
LADALIARGDEVLVLDDLSTGTRNNLTGALASGRCELIEGSMLDADLVDACMQKAEACFHLASAVGVKLIVAQPLQTLTRNVRGNDVVISAAGHHGRRLLFTSTSEVYGKNGGDTVHEECDRLLGPSHCPRWAYAIAKAFGESLAFAYHRELGTPTVVTRLFNTVGARQTGAYGMVLPRFVGQALAGEDLTVYGDGSQTRCFCHVTDTVDALVGLMDREDAAGRAFNVGTTDEITVSDLARRVASRLGSTSRIRMVSFQEAYGDDFEELGRRIPDTSALRDLTAWRPRRSVDEAIDDLVAAATESPRAVVGAAAAAGLMAATPPQLAG